MTITGVFLYAQAVFFEVVKIRPSCNYYSQRYVLVTEIRSQLSLDPSMVSFSTLDWFKE